MKHAFLALALLGLLLAGCDTAPSHAITGQISLDPALEDDADDNDVIFVFARAEEGPNMPLALLEMRVGDLPTEFTLTDEDAMGPAMTLSEAEQVRVIARVSKSGQAQAQPGDLEGRSGIVEPGARDVQVIIDQSL